MTKEEKKAVGALTTKTKHTPPSVIAYKIGHLLQAQFDLERQFADEFHFLSFEEIGDLLLRRDEMEEKAKECMSSFFDENANISGWWVRRTQEGRDRLDAYNAWAGGFDDNMP